MRMLEPKTRDNGEEERPIGSVSSNEGSSANKPLRIRGPRWLGIYRWLGFDHVDLSPEAGEQ